MDKDRFYIYELRLNEFKVSDGYLGVLGTYQNLRDVRSAIREIRQKLKDVSDTKCYCIMSAKSLKEADYYAASLCDDMDSIEEYEALYRAQQHIEECYILNKGKYRRVKDIETVFEYMSRWF